MRCYWDPGGVESGEDRSSITSLRRLRSRAPLKTVVFGEKSRFIPYVPFRPLSLFARSFSPGLCHGREAGPPALGEGLLTPPDGWTAGLPFTYRVRFLRICGLTGRRLAVHP